MIVIGDKGDAYKDLLVLIDKLSINDSISFLGGIQNQDVVNWDHQLKNHENHENQLQKEQK